MAQNPSIQNLESIKSALLITVVLSHVSAVTLPSLAEVGGLSPDTALIVVLKGMAAFGREAAYLFVLFSGYATAHHYLEATPARAASSVVRRVRRLYPPYAYALAATLALDTLGQTLAPAYYAELFPFPYAAAENGSAVTLLCNVAMLQPTFCHSFGTNGPLWTMGYLLQFYLVAWLLRAATPGVGAMALAGGALAVAATALLRLEWTALFALWVFGLQLRRGLDVRARHVPVPSLLAVAAGGVIAAKLGGPFWSMALMAPVGAALLLLSERNWRPAPRVVDEALGWLRANSLALYLLHMPVLAALAGTVTTAIGPVDRSVVAFISLAVLTILFSACLIAVYRSAERLFYLREWR